MGPEFGDVHLVEGGEGVHVSEEAEGLRDVAQVGSDTGQLFAEVGDCLRGLRTYATFDDAAVTQAELSGDDDPVAGTNDRGVRANRSSHAAKARRASARYPYRVRTTTRRDFLRHSTRLVLGGSAFVATVPMLASCGRAGGDLLPDDVQLVQRFPQNLVTGPIRLPISLASGGGLATTSGSITTPNELFAHIVRIDSDQNQRVDDGLVATRHDANLATPYWPFFADITEPGFYRLVVDGGPSDGAAFQVFPRGDIAVPAIGDRLPSLDTPTFADARGVDPVCTRQPTACPLHDTTLTEALRRGTRIALLVGTPAHCSTGTCTPALDALIKVAKNNNSITYIHAEVYADADATTIAPVVSSLGMTYEPALFVTDADGVITARLDAVFDEVELSSVLA